MTVAEAYALNCQRRDLRPVFVYHQRLLLRRLEAFLGQPILRASTADLEAYLDSRRLSPASRRSNIANLRAFYRWAHETDQIPSDPTRALVKPRKVPALPRPMPDGDVHRALAEAPCEVAPILALAVYAGLRAAEIAQLEAADLVDGVIRVRESKGGGESSVPLSPALAEVLERCPLPSSGWLFPAKRGAGHLSRVRICQIANRYLHSIGITQTLHTLRHAYGTALYRATRDLRLTQELMRHRSVQSTVGYTQVDSQDGIAAIAGLQW